ncbi:hypothetical protein [Candidatus Alkanophaga liquidiphilum]
MAVSAAFVRVEGPAFVEGGLSCLRLKTGAGDCEREACLAFATDVNGKQRPA